MDEEKRKAMYIANCNCCLIANSMKQCKICLFRIGLMNNAETWKEIMQQVKESEAKEREIR